MGRPVLGGNITPMIGKWSDRSVVGPTNNPSEKYYMGVSKNRGKTPKMDGF